MARYRVELTSAAVRELRKLDRQDADRVSEIDDTKVVVTVIKIGNRRDVYKGSW